MKVNMKVKCFHFHSRIKSLLNGGLISPLEPRYHAHRANRLPSPSPLPSRQPSSSLPPPPHLPVPLLSAQSSQQPLPSPLPLPSPSLQLSPLSPSPPLSPLPLLSLLSLPLPLPSPQEGTSQHKMPSNRANDNGGRDRGSHATVTHPEAKKMLSYGLSLVGFGNKRQKCREALSIRRFQAHYDIGPGAVQQLVSDLKKIRRAFQSTKSLYGSLLAQAPTSHIMLIVASSPLLSCSARCDEGSAF
jgi:hypothetical protein